MEVVNMLNESAFLIQLRRLTLYPTELRVHRDVFLSHFEILSKKINTRSISFFISFHEQISGFFTWVWDTFGTTFSTQHYPPHKALQLSQGLLCPGLI